MVVVVVVVAVATMRRTRSSQAQRAGMIAPRGGMRQRETRPRDRSAKWTIKHAHTHDIHVNMPSSQTHPPQSSRRRLTREGRREEKILKRQSRRPLSLPFPLPQSLVWLFVSAFCFLHRQWQHPSIHPFISVRPRLLDSWQGLSPTTTTR